MESLISAILGILGGGSDSGGVLGGNSGMSGPIGGKDGEFNTGMKHAMMLGGSSGGSGKGYIAQGKQAMQANAGAGLSALQQYKDMSQPMQYRQDYSGMDQGMQFAQMQNPGGPRVQNTGAAQPNAYVQALLQYMQGGR